LLHVVDSDGYPGFGGLSGYAAELRTALSTEALVASNAGGLTIGTSFVVDLFGKKPASQAVSEKLEMSESLGREPSLPVE
jgi:hypothetical protein